MSKIGLIIKREYFTIVAKKSFIFTTLLVPILSILVCGVLPMWMSQVKSDDKKTVAVVDQTDGQLFAPLFTATDEYVFAPVRTLPGGDDNVRGYFDSQEGLYAIVVLPNNFVESQSIHIFSPNSVAASLESDVKYLLHEPLRQQKIQSFEVEGLDEILSQCEVHLNCRTVKWGDEGKETISSAGIGMVLGMILAMLTYMFVLLYGAMILNSVVEEKTNRIVEVIVSCCRPFDLMMGKIIGVALVGLTQLAIWGALLTLIGGIFGIGSMFAGGPSADVTGALNDPQVQAALAEAQEGGAFSEIIEMVSSLNFTQIVVCFLLYFIGGYLLYASLFAALGSAVDQASDASQFTTPIMIVMVFALYAAIFSMENPDGPLAWWCSIIPFTSPIVMMVRLPFDVSIWELVLSISLLFATALGIGWVAGRIYRTGILLYGRKISIKEIVRWIK